MRVFGICNGMESIHVTNDFNGTAWMYRCFADLLKGKGRKAIVPLGKGTIYSQLKTFCDLDDNIHSEDVARLLHCYMLSSLFMPDGNTSISWSLLEYPEDFKLICHYDWSSLIVTQLVNKIVQTRTLKAAGSTMLLPVILHSFF